MTDDLWRDRLKTEDRMKGQIDAVVALLKTSYLNRPTTHWDALIAEANQYKAANPSIQKTPEQMVRDAIAKIALDNSQGEEINFSTLTSGEATDRWKLVSQQLGTLYGQARDVEGRQAAFKQPPRAR